MESVYIEAGGIKVVVRSEAALHIDKRAMDLWNGLRDALGTPPAEEPERPAAGTGFVMERADITLNDNREGGEGAL